MTSLLDLFGGAPLRCPLRPILTRGLRLVIPPWLAHVSASTALPFFSIAFHGPRLICMFWETLPDRHAGPVPFPSAASGPVTPLATTAAPTSDINSPARRRVPGRPWPTGGLVIIPLLPHWTGRLLRPGRHSSTVASHREATMRQRRHPEQS